MGERALIKKLLSMGTVVGVEALLLVVTSAPGVAECFRSSSVEAASPPALDDSLSELRMFHITAASDAMTTVVPPKSHGSRAFLCPAMEAESSEEHLFSFLLVLLLASPV